MKPFAESCDQNQADILQVLKGLLNNSQSVLEIGSGTGQHAVYFAKHLPHLTWHTSDQIEYHQGIQLWLDEADLVNTRSPIALHVSNHPWPTQTFDAIFSANAVHIMSWNNVVNYFKNGCKVLAQEGLFILYGPFNINGEYTSHSNERFDQWLKTRDPKSGIRDFNALDDLAKQHGLSLQQSIKMPSNNRILYWKKTA